MGDDERARHMQLHRYAISFADDSYASGATRLCLTAFASADKALSIEHDGSHPNWLVRTREEAANELIAVGHIREQSTDRVSSHANQSGWTSYRRRIHARIITTSEICTPSSIGFFFFSSLSLAYLNRDTTRRRRRR